MRAFDWIYGGLWRAITPFLRLNRRFADGFEQRTDIRDLPHGADVWIQSASGGEAYLTLCMLRRLAEKIEGRSIRVLATTWTRQGLDTLSGAGEAFAPGIELYPRFFPLDRPDLMRKAVERVRPRLVVLMETEIWPGFLDACHRYGIPVIVLNGRMEQNVSKTVRNVLKWIGARLEIDRVLAVNLDAVRRYNEFVGRSCAELAGNMKFDNAAKFLEDSSVLDRPLRALLPDEDAILLASVRSGEEKLLFQTVSELKQRTDAPIIVAPRHMHRTAAWMRRLRSFYPVLRSDLLTPIARSSVVIWDTFGELTALYASCRAVFVGGSLVPLGGQNFLEPLSFGRIPCCGPFLDHFAWALEGTPGLRSMGLLDLTENVPILVDHLLQRTIRPEDPAEVLRLFRAWLESRVGGAEKSAECVASYLFK
ncbi:MAG: glycosyltransferase N-terminal domain-containing protein [Desulfovibrionaceae bacterium]|nr:glycosyltransferase N-terminal domain-containing protein [Desulfovibrionaceae bacterium]